MTGTYIRGLVTFTCTVSIDSISVLNWQINIHIEKIPSWPAARCYRLAIGYIVFMV